MTGATKIQGPRDLNINYLLNLTSKYFISLAISPKTMLQSDRLSSPVLRVHCRHYHRAAIRLSRRNLIAILSSVWIQMKIPQEIRIPMQASLNWPVLCIIHSYIWTTRTSVYDSSEHVAPMDARKRTIEWVQLTKRAIACTGSNMNRVGPCTIDFPRSNRSR